MARDRKGFVEGHDEQIGKNEFAGMPKEVMMREYPEAPMGRTGILDDSMTDIDDVQEQAAGRRNRYISNQK